MNSFKVKKSVLWTCFLLMIFYLIMELYYFHFIGVSYSRFGFSLDINSRKYLETKILFVIILCVSVFVSRFSEFIYSIFIFFVIFFLIPTFVTYSFSNQIPGPLYATIVLLLAVGVISVNRLQVPSLKSASFSYGVALLTVIAALIPFLYSFGFYFNFKNILLNDVANTRSFYDDNTSTALNYLYNWMVKTIVPVLIIYFLIHKRYFYAVLSLGVLLYLYIISGNKIVYITSFVILFFFFLGKDHTEKVKYFLWCLIIILLLLPVIDAYVLHDHSLKGLFVMRMLFLPSQLNYYYFDFFKDNPLYFSESSFFSYFHTYPFDQPVGFVIAQKYFHTDDMNANNGIISDGFMNLGYIGVGINIMLVTLTFLFFNSTNPDSRYLGVFFVVIFLFLSAPMLSMFITSGLWILFVFSFNVMRAKIFNKLT